MCVKLGALIGGCSLEGKTCLAGKPPTKVDTCNPGQICAVHSQGKWKKTSQRGKLENEEGEKRTHAGTQAKHNKEGKGKRRRTVCRDPHKCSIATALTQCLLRCWHAISSVLSDLLASRRVKLVFRPRFLQVPVVITHVMERSRRS